MNRQLKSGKTRSHNLRFLAEEGLSELTTQRDELLAQQEQAAEVRRDIARSSFNINNHTTSDADRNMAHTTSAINRALTVTTGKDVEWLLLQQDRKKLDTTDTAAVLAHNDKLAAMEKSRRG